MDILINNAGTTAHKINMELNLDVINTIAIIILAIGGGIAINHIRSKLEYIKKQIITISTIAHNDFNFIARTISDDRDVQTEVNKKLADSLFEAEKLITSMVKKSKKSSKK